MVWDTVLTGNSAKDTAAELEWLASNPMLIGEMVSLRIKDGKGGGCETNGSYLDLKIENTGEESQTADVYFYADKWRSW